jgi:exodeoxyribonuclease VII large subunit
MAARGRLEQLMAKLNALSPLASLDRGFSITRKEMDLVRNHQQLVIDDSVTILFADGAADARITTLHESHPNTQKPNR